MVLFGAYLGVALILYGPALRGDFVSDDHHYVANNVFVHQLDFGSVVTLFEPLGPATHAVVNYTPVHLLLHAVVWSLFGPETFGHHVVNVVFHVVASLLLVPLFLRTGIPLAGALLGSVLFLVHPANVEAVAWISQLKTTSGMVFSLAALLAVPRRPALGTVFFALALLAKPTSAFALPVAVLFAWGSGERIPWKWFGAWAACFAAYATAEFAAHQRSGAAAATLYETPLALLMTFTALPARYVAMAASSWGVSAFHEVEPVTSPLDGWWLLALLGLALLCWRVVVLWRRRDAELGYWAWAVVSYGPVSPLFPFLYQFADRYLYAILPGLLGAALSMAVEAGSRLPAWLQRVGGPFAHRDPAALRRDVGRAALALGAVLVVVFAVRAESRAGIWKNGSLLLVDAAVHYPDGVSANLLRLKRAAQAGDVEGAVAAVQAARARGYNRFDHLTTDPALAPVLSQAAFRALMAEMAEEWIDKLEARPERTQGDLRMIARAHIVRGEYGEAERALRRALEQGGALDAQLRNDLTDLAGLQ